MNKKYFRFFRFKELICDIYHVTLSKDCQMFLFPLRHKMLFGSSQIILQKMVIIFKQIVCCC